MTLSRIKLTNAIFCCMVVNETVLLFIQPWISGFIQSLLIYGLWAESISLVLFIVFQNKQSIEKSIFWILIICICFFISILGGSGHKGAAFIGFLEFLLTLLPYYWSQYLKSDYSQLKTIQRCAIAKTVFFILMSFSSKKNASYYIDQIAIHDGSLTLGYSNPNITGLLILNTMTVLLSILNDREQKDKISFLIYGGIAYLEYLLVRTQSRMAIVCSLFLVILYLLRNNMSIRKIFTSKIVLRVALILPIIFLFVFYYLYRHYSSFLFMGAQIYSRMGIYNATLNFLSENTWFGDATIWQFRNSHNGILSIAANLGIVGCIAYLVFMFKRLSNYAGFIREDENANIIPYIVALMFLLYSCVESAMVSGSVQFSTEVAIVCVLCERNRKIKETERE